MEENPEILFVGGVAGDGGGGAGDAPRGPRASGELSRDNDAASEDPILDPSANTSSRSSSVTATTAAVAVASEAVAAAVVFAVVALEGDKLLSLQKEPDVFLSEDPDFLLLL